MFHALDRAGAALRNGGGDFAQTRIERYGTAVGGDEFEAREALPMAVAQPAEFHGIGLRGGCNGDGVQALDVARHFILQTEHFFNAAQALVHEGGAFEIHIRAEALAGRGGGIGQRMAAGMEKLGYAAGLAAILLHTYRLLAGAEAAAHLAIHAAGVIGTGHEILLAAAQLEEIEEFGIEKRSGGAIAEGSEIDVGSAADARSDVCAREGVGEHQLHVRRKAQADLPAVIAAPGAAARDPKAGAAIRGATR